MGLSAAELAHNTGDDDPELIERLAWMLVRIENNYRSETSGPGSRFEGERLEVVQARALIREVRAR